MNRLIREKAGGTRLPASKVRFIGDYMPDSFDQPRYVFLCAACGNTLKPAWGRKKCRCGV